MDCVRKVNAMWYLLVTDLDAISVDHFNSDTPNSKYFLRSLREEIFLVLQFVNDSLSDLNFWSLKMQQSTGLLIDFSSFNRKITGTSKRVDGKTVSQFLNRVIFSDTI